MLLYLDLPTMHPMILSIDVDVQDTIESVRAKIHDKFGIPPEMQRLISDCRQMRDEEKLEDYKLPQEGDLVPTVRMIFRRNDDYNITREGLRKLAANEDYDRTREQLRKLGANESRLFFEEKALLQTGKPEGRGYPPQDSDISTGDALMRCHTIVIPMQPGAAPVTESGAAPLPTDGATDVLDDAIDDAVAPAEGAAPVTESGAAPLPTDGATDVLDDAIDDAVAPAEGACIGATEGELPYEWIYIRRGDTIPVGAVCAGRTKVDGELYIGRNTAGVGKMNTDDGKLWNLWIRGYESIDEGEIFVIKNPAYRERWEQVKKGDKLPSDVVLGSKWFKEKTENVYVCRGEDEEVGTLVVKKGKVDYLQYQAHWFTRSEGEILCVERAGTDGTSDAVGKERAAAAGKD